MEIEESITRDIKITTITLTKQEVEKLYGSGKVHQLFKYIPTYITVVKIQVKSS